MSHAFYFCCCFLLPLIGVRGSGQTECTATEEGTLKCQFSENINSTQRDFSIYFNPDYGSEEQLVACSWIKSQLYCITQKGFQCEGLVSETAVITIPKSFLSRNGSYRCENIGYPFIATPCQIPARRDVKEFANCEANSTFDSNQFSLECNFPFTVEGFRVIYNTSVLATYTKSSCKMIYPVCDYKAEEGKTTFTLTLNTTKHLHGEFSCQPDSIPFGLEVKGCIVAMKTHTDDSPVLSGELIAVVCFIPLVLLAVAVVVAVVLLRRKRKQAEEEEEEEEEVEEEEEEENKGKRKCILKRLLWDHGIEDLQLQTYEVKPISA